MNKLPLVLTYNLTNPDVIGLVTKFWPILQTSVKGAILFNTELSDEALTYGIT